MKSILKKVAGIAIMATLALGIMSCKQNVDTHEHTFATTYSSDATHHWHAATCEHTTEVKDKVEHSFGEWTVITQPTEEAEGTKEKECSVCGYKATETIAKLDHVHTKGTHREAVASTCKTKGTIAYYDCTRTTCEVKLDAEGNPLAKIEGELDPANHEGIATAFEAIDTDSHKEIYKCCNAVKTASASHTWNYGVVTKEPTTTEEGVKTYTCTAEGCGQTKTESIAKLPAISSDFILIPAGTFKMGSNSNQGYDNNMPVHNVTISKAFYMCDHEVTQKEYEDVMETNPSYHKTGAYEGEVQENRPVEQVSWYMAIVYCNKRSLAENLTPCYTISGKTNPSEWGEIPTSQDETWDKVECNWTANGYRLPTEAEWEYAARAGDTTVDSLTWSGTNAETSLIDYAWYARGKTHEVKKTTGGANVFGLYDMCGNVFEWCWDWNGLYSARAATDPRGVTSGSDRVNRGGSYICNSRCCAVSYRDYYYPGDSRYDIGFRVVRSAN